MPDIIDDPYRARRMDVITRRGVPFMVLCDPAAALVEFWDLRYPTVHSTHRDLDMPGQFTGGRYSIETLITPDDDHHWSALILQGDEPDWCIDDRTMAVVRTWLRLIQHRTT